MLSETWRPNKAEIWESRQAPIRMGAGKLENKHGVAILLNKKQRKIISLTEYTNERAIATITVNKQRITLMSVYFPHSVHADHHFEKAYSSIEKLMRSTKNMQIVGGHFNAELRPGIGIERFSVGPHALESNRRGDWLKLWLMLQKFVALNMMYRKHLNSKLHTGRPKVQTSNWTTSW